MFGAIPGCSHICRAGSLMGVKSRRGITDRRSAAVCEAFIWGIAAFAAAEKRPEMIIRCATHQPLEPWREIGRTHRKSTISSTGNFHAAVLRACATHAASETVSLPRRATEAGHHEPKGRRQAAAGTCAPRVTPESRTNWGRPKGNDLWIKDLGFTTGRCGRDVRWIGRIHDAGDTAALGRGPGPGDKGRWAGSCGRAHRDRRILGSVGSCRAEPLRGLCPREDVRQCEDRVSAPDVFFFFHAAMQKW